MESSIFVRMLALAALACSAATVAAAEQATSDASSAYKLRIENASTFRLTAREPYLPIPEPKRDQLVPARLADKPFAELIQNAARDTALDPALLHALIYVESRYNPGARSPKGAVGLMQVLPETALRYGVADPARSPEANLRAGTRYLRDLLQIFDNHLDLALAAYNAGQNAVQRYGVRIPPYAETRAYVPAVLAKYREWKEPPQAAPAPGRIHILYLTGTLLEPDSVGTSGER